MDVFKLKETVKDAFEKKFLAATEKLYAAEGQKLINDLAVPGYLAHAGMCKSVSVADSFCFIRKATKRRE